MAMGAADVVPGVSGGTIAFITGIYEELIKSISNIGPQLFINLKKEGVKNTWNKANGGFLLSLFIGIAISIFSLMRITNHLLETYPILVWSFFFGLVLASIFYVGKQIESWKPKHIVFFILGFAVAFGISLLSPSSDSTSLIYLFFAGSIAICAMILPGISGAFILVLLGAYKNISEAVSNFDLKVIASFGLGAIFGLLTFSRILKWLFKHYQTSTLAVLTGFIAGSLIKIWPWRITTKTIEVKDKIINVSQTPVLPNNYDGEALLLPSISLMIVGIGVILLLEFFGNKPLKK
ncbi:DUF368 domain-containing protein [Psychroflexus maritimus]|uniref:DUF368 domain-containing protein n=1 Tax=Psychroflexus maritimus TaxID=2714865 RepID=A0A967AEL6_9FLAO|nr:DUF368 domain-containing protein [Psychroflexus maritimus]NGZ89086.1 DUF368 domain-containing protein [Psychroflexus maritimus]